MTHEKIARLVDNLLSGGLTRLPLLCSCIQKPYVPVNDAANPSLTYTIKEDLIREAAELCTQIVLEQDTMIEIEAPVNVNFTLKRSE